MAVNNLQVTENREGGIITVTWTPPSERNGSISYNLTYSGFQVPPYPPSRALGMSGTFIINEASNVSHQITGALAFAKYTINVFAFNKQLGQTAASTTETRAIMTHTIRKCYIVNSVLCTSNKLHWVFIFNDVYSKFWTMQFFYYSSPFWNIILLFSILYSLLFFFFYHSLFSTFLLFLFTH